MALTGLVGFGIPQGPAAGAAFLLQFGDLGAQGLDFLTLFRQLLLQGGAFLRRG